MYHFIHIDIHRLCLRCLNNIARRKDPYLQLLLGRTMSGSATLRLRLRMSRMQQPPKPEQRGTHATPLLLRLRSLNRSRKKAGRSTVNSSVPHIYYHRSFSGLIYWWLVRVTLVVDWLFLPQNFGPVVGTYQGLLQLCECTSGGGCFCRWWGHLNTLWCYWTFFRHRWWGP